MYINVHTVQFKKQIVSTSGAYMLIRTYEQNLKCTNGEKIVLSFLF